MSEKVKYWDAVWCGGRIEYHHNPTGRVVKAEEYEAERRAHAETKAKLEEARKVLRKVEWTTDDGCPRCPWCAVYKDNDNDAHWDNCRLAAVIEGE